MAVGNDKDITLGFIRVLEAGTLVFVLDLIDQSIEAANDILRGSGRRGECMLAWEDDTPWQCLTHNWNQALDLEHNEEKKNTYSPPGHPSVQIFHGPSPLSARCSRICLLVNPS